MTEQSGYPGAPPGWYPDPAGGPGQRWWDGYAWTESSVLPQRPPPPPWASASPPQGPPTQVAPWAEASQRLATVTTASLVNDEMRMAPLARFAVALPAVYVLAALIADRLNAPALRNAGHQFRLDWHDAQLGKTPPPYHGSGTALSPLVLLLGLVTVGAIVVACIWQHRATSAGRSLGIPSRQSPAWGVGAWFVPVCWYWIPYTAVRDCLPPGHPQRRRVLHWWIACLFTFNLGVLAGILAFTSTGASLVVSIPAALAGLVVIALAPGIVTAIAGAHGEALATTHREGVLSR